MYLKHVYICISSCFILFDICFSLHPLKMKYKNDMNHMKGVTFFLSPQIYRKNINRSRIKNVSLKKKKKPLFLFENLKKGFSFLGFWRNKYDQKYIDDVTSNINNLIRIKQVTQKKKSNELTIENIKQILLRCVFSKIDFKIINSLSYIIKHFQMSNTTVHSILNQISEKVKEKKDAENYLALHLFLLKDENITLFSMMHIMDFFKSKQKVVECIRDIKRSIYEECVGDLIRKKIERYNLYCEKKKIKFNMKDAIKKMELNIKDDDLYFHYDYNELLRCFTMRLNMERNNNKNKIRSNYDNINIDKDMDMNNNIDGNINNISLDEKIKEQFEDPDDENLKELKVTYEEFQLFNDNIIKYIEEDQQLYNINSNNINSNINRIKNKNKIKENNNNGNSDSDDYYDDYNYEKEEDLVIQKNIDDYIYKNTTGMNKSLEEFKNQFIEQADIEFKNFLSNVNLDQHGNVKRNDENTKNSNHIKNRNTINKDHDTDLILQHQKEDNFLKKNIQNNMTNDINDNEINMIQLKKLNRSDEDINLTSDLIYERIRTKLLWYIQKIEYLKFKYQYDIINEQFPIIKNEKTVLDLLNYGYKIVMAPDVDNSLFEKTKMDALPNDKDKNNQMENQKNSDKEDSENISICPQCKTKV